MQKSNDLVLSGYQCVNGLLLIIISIFDSPACISAYVNLLFCNYFFSKSFTLQTRRSKNPPCQGANVRLKCHLTIKLLMTFWESFETKFLPLPLIILSGYRRLLIKRLTFLINDSADKLGTTSNIIFLVEAHVHNVTHTFLISQSFLLKIFRACTGPKLSTPVVKKGCVSTNWSLANDGVSGYL